MFQPNDDHRQQRLFDGEDLLPEKLKRRLETSWAGTFYREVFCPIDEQLFAVLYSEEASRPNTPVNILVALEILKSGFGWSDRALYDQLCYNLQVRYAVGLRDLAAEVFKLRTLYNFRRRVREHAEATYRVKGGQTYRGGYVAGVSETCAEDNDVQRITDVQVAPNATDDAELLARSLASQAERSHGPEQMSVDGGFTGPVAEAACQDHETELRPTRLRGGKSAPETLGWEAYQWRLDEEERPEAVTCPQGQRARVAPGQAEGRYIVRFSSEVCAGCSLLGGPGRVVERRAGSTLYLTQRSIEVALQRQRLCPEDRSIRAPVEATMRELKLGFAGSKLSVRGLLRASMLLYGAAMRVNVRRLHRLGADREVCSVFSRLVLLLRALHSALRSAKGTFLPPVSENRPRSLRTKNPAASTISSL